jgi:hypothetical protein
MDHEHEFHATSQDPSPTTQKEAEPPPDPEFLEVGGVALRTGESNVISYLKTIAEVGAFWPADSMLNRQVVLVTLPDSDEFLAFGTFTPVNDPVHCCKTPFVVWGKVSADRELFLMQMGSEVEVGLYSQAPVAYLQEYINEHFSHPLLMQASLQGVAWQQACAPAPL